MEGLIQIFHTPLVLKPLGSTRGSLSRGSVSTGALGACAPINLEERVQCTRPENINVNLVFSIIIIKFKFEVNKLHIT